MRNTIEVVGKWIGMTDQGWRQQDLYVATNCDGEQLRCKSRSVAEYWLKIGNEYRETVNKRLFG